VVAALALALELMQVAGAGALLLSFCNWQTLKPGHNCLLSFFQHKD